MLKRLSKCVREYKLPAILTVLFIAGEAIIVAIIPFVTAKLVNGIEDGREISYVLKMGGILVALALVSLACGGIAAFTCAKASAGFAKNLRHDMFGKVQSYAFGNIDKFSSSSLVTRMTTDITNVQMSFMMITRIAIIIAFSIITSSLVESLSVITILFTAITESFSIKFWIRTPVAGLP